MATRKMKRYKDGDLIQDDATSVDEQEDDTSALTAYTPPKPAAKTAVSSTKRKPTPAFTQASVSGPGRKPTGSSAASSTPTDVTKMSVSDRFKASRAKSREGTTDTRSVGERLRSAFGMAKGGSASSRADGIAQRGKTRGTMMCSGGMAKGKK